MKMRLQTGDSQTSVVGNIETVREFATSLLAACKNSEMNGMDQQVDEIFEQLKCKGPWRITIHIMEK